jgi:hypothetical protein
VEGTIRGSLTVKRGKRECVLEGVMDEDADDQSEPAPPTAATLPAS